MNEFDGSRHKVTYICGPKVNSSLQLKPNLTGLNDNAGDNAQANLWMQSPPSAKPMQISVTLTDSEESSEEIEKVKELRRLRHGVSAPLDPYDDDDIIILSPNNCSEKQFSPIKDISRELQLKFRCRTDIYKILVHTSAPLSQAVDQLSHRLKVPPSRILLLRKDIELPVQATANELELGIADIIDCVVIAVEEKQVPEENSEYITLRLQGKEKGSAQEYSLHKNAPFGSILSEYLSSLTEDAHRKVHFLFDGSKITNSQTPAELDMEDGDVIEVWD
ncbi:NFATC2-interacting protein [Aplochiton taeniatus]